MLHYVRWEKNVSPKDREVIDSYTFVRYPALGYPCSVLFKFVCDTAEF